MQKAKTISFPEDFPSSYPQQPRKWGGGSTFVSCDVGLFEALTYCFHSNAIMALIIVESRELTSQKAVRNPNMDVLLGLNTASEASEAWCWSASAAEIAAAYRSLVAGNAHSMSKVGHDRVWDLEMKLPTWDWRDIQTEPSEVQKLRLGWKKRKQHLKKLFEFNFGSLYYFRGD